MDVTRPSCGGYTVEKTLGMGGNAVVKLVSKVDGDSGERKEYAMKIFEPHQSNFAAGGKLDKNWQDFIQKTQFEYDIVRKLNSGKIIKYYDFNPDAVWHKKNGQDKKCAYLLMEIVDGVELFDFFRSGQEIDEKMMRHVFLNVV